MFVIVVNPLFAIIAIVVTSLIASLSYGKRWQTLTTGLPTIHTKQNLANLRRDSVFYAFLLILILAILAVVEIYSTEIGDTKHIFAWTFMAFAVIYNVVCTLANWRELAA